MKNILSYKFSTLISVILISSLIFHFVQIIVVNEVLKNFLMMMIVLPACGALAALPIRVFRSMSQDGFLSIDTQEKAEAVAGISDELVCRNIDEYRLNKNSEEIKNNQYQEIEFRKSGITLAKETKQVEFDVRNQLIRKDRDGDMKMIDFNNWGH